ncbi:MAG: T9SS type A sorting domain-containing protein [bacterium]
MEKINSLKKCFSLLIGILVSTALFASAPDTLWTRTYGGLENDGGTSVQQTSDGGFVLAGTTESFGAGYYDVYLIRIDSLGDTLWTKTFGGTYGDLGYSIQQTSDGGFIIAGTTSSFGTGGYDVYLIRTNSSGDTLWTKTFGGTNEEAGFSVQQTSDDGFIIVGYTQSFGTGGADVYLIRTDSLGNTLWTRTIGGAGRDVGYSVQQTKDGGVIIAGWTSSFGAGQEDAYLIRTDSLGDTLWTRTFGGVYGDYGYSVKQTSDGGFVVTGEISFVGGGDYDVGFIKTDSSGTPLWAKAFGGTAEDGGYSVQQTSDSGFIIAGYTASFSLGYKDVHIIRTNSLGDTLWTKTFGGTGNDNASSVQQAQNGGFIIAGRTTSFGAGGGDVYLIRLGKETGVEEQANLDFGLGIAELKIIKNKIYLDVSKSINADVKIYDLGGRLQSTVYEGALKKGNYTFVTNIKKNGIYFVRLSTGTLKVTKKITVIK